MINRLEHVADIKKLKGWDEKVVLYTKSVLAMLDNSYGVNRNVQKDLGGFVLFCDRDTTANDLNDLIKISYDLYEWADEVETAECIFVIAHYVISCDYNIVIVMPKELFDELIKKDD